jgi:hypothetical protein
MDKFLFKRPRLHVQQVSQEQQGVSSDTQIQNQVVEAVDIVPVPLPQSHSHQLQHAAGISSAKETNRPGIGKPRCC